MAKKSKLKKPSVSRAALVSAVVIGLISLVVTTVVVIKYVQRNTLAKEEAAFITMLSRAEDMVENISAESVENIATDSSKFCYYQSNEKFKPEKLYCEINIAGHYKVEDFNTAEQLAAQIQQEYANNFSGKLYGPSENSRPDKIVLSAPFIKDTSQENISCGATVIYPHTLRDYRGMPGRTFDEKNVLHLSISCVKQVREPFFQLLTDETDYF